MWPRLHELVIKQVHAKRSYFVIHLCKEHTTAWLVGWLFGFYGISTLEKHGMMKNETASRQQAAANYNFCYKT